MESVSVSAVAAVCLLLLLLQVQLVAASTRTRALCARGRYSITHAGQVPCLPCPRGRYGDTYGLTESSCTNSCGPGKYQPKLGVETVADCMLCPPNTWSSLSGVTSDICTPCSTGRYNLLWGASQQAACLVCDAGYMSAECMDDVMMTTEGQINGL